MKMMMKKTMRINLKDVNSNTEKKGSANLLNNKFPISSNKIVDEEMKKIYFSFRNYYFLQNSNLDENYLSRNLNQLVKEIYNKNPCELSWGILYLTASNKLTKQFEKTKGVRMLLSLFLFMADTGEYAENDINQLLENRENLKQLIKVSAENYLKFFLLKNTCPNSVICWSDSKAIRAIVIDSKNQFLLFLFREYINRTNLKCGDKISSCYKVFAYFELAIFPIEINSFFDINDNVFFTYSQYFCFFF